MPSTPGRREYFPLEEDGWTMQGGLVVVQGLESVAYVEYRVIGVGVHCILSHPSELMSSTI